MFALSVFLRERLLARTVFAEDEVKIGRNPDNEVQIDNPGVSRYHAGIETLGGVQIVKDFGSDNGTYVNGERVVGRRALQDGDRIGTGKFIILYRCEQAPGAVAPEIGDKAAYAIAGQTIVTAGSPAVRERRCPLMGHLELPALGREVPRTHLLDRDVTLVGSAPGSDLLFDAKRCPARAAVLLRGWLGFKLLALAPGVRRNRASVETHVDLASRDELVFGDAPCRFFVIRHEAAA